MKEIILRKIIFLTKIIFFLIINIKFKEKEIIKIKRTPYRFKNMKTADYSGMDFIGSVQMYKVIIKLEA